MVASNDKAELVDTGGFLGEDRAGVEDVVSGAVWVGGDISFVKGEDSVLLAEFFDFTVSGRFIGGEQFRGEGADIVCGSMVGGKEGDKGGFRGEGAG